MPSIYSYRKRSVPEATERIISDLIRVEEIEQPPLVDYRAVGGREFHHNVPDRRRQPSQGVLQDQNRYFVFDAVKLLLQ